MYSNCNIKDKCRIVNEFMDSLRSNVLNAVEYMPEDWDGHELRAYIAEKASYEVSRTMRFGRSKRVKDFKNELIVNYKL